MAIQTFQHSSFDGGAVRIEFDINTANWRLSQVRCINNTAVPALAVVYDSGTPIFSAEGIANQTTSWNTTGVQLDWDDVDGGIIWGTLVMEVRYPA